VDVEVSVADDRTEALDETKDRIDPEDFPKLVKERIAEWESHTGDWRKEARTNFDVVAGRQWTDVDKTMMESLGRPMVTLNSLAAMVRAICGLEINSRQATTYYARYAGMSGKAEVLTQAVKYARDECNAEDEESSAFRDMVICGMGFTETRMVYDDNPAGEIWIERLDPMQCAWDASSRRRGLQDARWRATWRDLPRAEVERLWPDKAEELSEAFWPSDSELGGEAHNADEAAWYPSGAAGFKPKGTARVVQYQYWRETPFVKVEGPGGKMEVPRKEGMRAKQLGLQVTKARPRREYRQAIVSAGVTLEDEALPIKEFTINALTGIVDRNEGIWYGFVRDLVDPQKFINKFVSLAVDILAANAKGGIMAETDAFVNHRKAEEDWANPTKIIWLKSGAVSGGKIQERNATAFPPALTQLMEFAVNGMPRISGVNMEFIGAQTNNQAGVLEYQRKQAVVSGLSEFFSGLRLYRKVQGKGMAEFVAKYLNDGRLVRIVGPEGAKYIPLILQDESTEYDLVVDESPSAPDTKARTWAALIDILPAAMKMGIPVPPEILDYSPLPASLAEKWKQMLAGGKPNLPPQVQEQIKKMGEEMTKLQQENVQLKTNNQAKLAQLEADRQYKMGQLDLEGRSKIADLRLRQEIAALDAEIEREKMIGQLTLERERMLAEFGLKAEMQDGTIGVQHDDMVRKHDLARQDMDKTHELARTKADSDTEMAKQKFEQVAPSDHVTKLVENVKALGEQIAELQKPKSRSIMLKFEGGKVSGADVVEEGGKRQTVTVKRQGGKVKGGTTTPGGKNGE
jgi:hypothetical protein